MDNILERRAVESGIDSHYPMADYSFYLEVEFVKLDIGHDSAQHRAWLLNG